ncbi:MAG TPA: hypothetical protein VLH36_07630, partial [Steroidobacteraceae bacterium]|nr:hypothetical protein [Steroidobacteraceae bacterium]
MIASMPADRYSTARPTHKEATLMRSRIVLMAATFAVLAACAKAPDVPGTPGAASGAASRQTVAANAAVASALPLGEMQDFEDAQRGFIATDVPLKVAGADGTTAWDFESYAFVTGDAPPTVN